MGGTVSKNTNAEITNVAKSWLSKSINSCIMSSDDLIDIKLTDIEGDVSMSNIDAYQNVNVDFNCIGKRMKKEGFGTKLNEKIDDYIKSTDEAIISSLSNEDTENINDFKNSIVEKFENFDYDTLESKVREFTEIGVGKVAGSVVIKDLHIHEGVKQIVDHIVQDTELFNEIDGMSKILDNHTLSKETDIVSNLVDSIKNIFSNPEFLATVIAVVVGIIAVVYGITKVRG